MNTKLLFLWIAGFALSVFSCNSGSNVIQDEEMTNDDVPYIPLPAWGVPGGRGIWNTIMLN